MRNYYKLILLSVLSFFGLQGKAQQVSVEEAEAKAMSFLNAPAQVKARKVQASPNSLKLAYKSESGNKSLFYVFNSTSSVGGFVIVGGDEAAQDILGYSERGSFDYATMPANLKWWLSLYNMQIEEAIKDVQSGNASIVKESSRKLSRRKAKSNIPYFLTTEWDQVAPFNSQIPLNTKPGFTGTYALATGCVATAGAQIMKYYNWPTSGIGSATMSKPVNGETYSADFANTTYDWTNMQDTYSYDKYTGSASDKAVGTLMYHIGVAVDMNYGQLNSGGSGASTHTLAIRLAETFKYDKGIMYKNRSSYTVQDWEDLIYSELKERRPVLYSGTSDAPDGGGHAFVCDGYQDGRYHINWGWSGSYNGYFLLTSTSTEKALAPNGTGSGGSAANSSYIQDQSIVMNIKPDYTGTSVAPKIIEAKEYTMPSTNVSRGERTYINGMMFNKGMFEDTFEFAVKLVNTSDASDTHFVETTTTFNLVPNQGRGYIYFNVPGNVRPGAYYYVYPMYKNEKNEWVETGLPLNFEVPTIKINVPTGFEVNNIELSNANYVSEGNFNLSFDIENWGQFAATKKIVVYIFPSVGGSSVDWINVGNVSINSRESKHFDLTYDDLGSKSLQPGNKYFLSVYDGTNNDWLSDNVYFTFCNNLNINYEMTSVGWGTICLPFEAEVPSGLTAYNVTSVGDKGILEKEEVEKFSMNTPYLVSGNAGTSYTFSGPDTPTGSNFNNGILVGNTAPSVEGSYVYAPQGSYVLQNNNGKLGFYKVENANSQKIRQYSAYISEGSNYSLSKYLGIDAATEISDVQENELDAPAYNLNGIRVKKNAKGFVIVNGKLIYNK